jgi:hypothetical protein
LNIARAVGAGKAIGQIQQWRILTLSINLVYSLPKGDMGFQMSALILGTAVLGAALGRFFKWLVLAPLTAAIAFIIFLEPSFWPHSALPKTVQFLALTVSLQFGYTLTAWLQWMGVLWQRHMNFRPLPITEVLLRRTHASRIKLTATD